MSNLNDLELRIESIEKQIANGLRGSAGPRGEKGSPGDISAAVANVERVVDDKLADLYKRVDDSCARINKENADGIASIRRELSSHRKEVRESLAGYFSEESTKNRIEKAVVELLVEYWVLDNDMNLLGRNQKPLEKQPLQGAGE